MPFRFSLVRRVIAFMVLFGLAGASPAAEPGWGNLKGQFTVKGEVFDKRIIVGRQSERIPDESLLIDSISSGLANVVVYLRVLSGGEKPTMKPEAVQLTNGTVKLNCEYVRYAPRISMLMTGQDWVIRNTSRVGQNLNLTTLRNAPQNLLLQTNEEKLLRFDLAEPNPIRVTDNIHPWRRGIVVIQDHPFMAVTDETGSFEIRDLPAGRWTFQFFHERIGNLVAKPDWTKGRVALEIAANQTNDLGTITIPAELCQLAQSQLYNDSAEGAYDELLRQSDQRKAREIAARISTFTGESYFWLLKAVDSNNDVAREAAIIELIERHGTRVHELMITGLKDENGEIAYRCAKQVGDLKVNAAKLPLQAIVQNRRVPARIRFAAAKSLAQLGDRSVLPILIEGLDHDDFLPRFMSNKGIVILTGKGLTDFDYEIFEGQPNPNDDEAEPIAVVERIEARAKRYQALMAWTNWLKAERTDLYALLVVKPNPRTKTR